MEGVPWIEYRIYVATSHMPLRHSGAEYLRDLTLGTLGEELKSCFSLRRQFREENEDEQRKLSAREAERFLLGFSSARILIRTFSPASPAGEGTENIYSRLETQLRATINPTSTLCHRAPANLSISMSTRTVETFILQLPE